MPPTPSPAPSAGLSSNIACWGDSLTPPFAANLQGLIPARTVFDGGVVAQDSISVRTRMVADSGRHNWVSVFWFGHNNTVSPAQINADLAAAYPQNYLDIRSYQVNLYNPALPQDATDHANDVPPASLRHDEGHLNNDGSVAVASRVRDFITARGW